MSYVDPDDPSKAAFKRTVTAGVAHATYNPSGQWPTVQNGFDTVEGPHNPKPHRWWARVEVVEGYVVRVVS